MNVKTKELKKCGKGRTKMTEGVPPRVFLQRVHKWLKGKEMTCAKVQESERRVRMNMKTGRLSKRLFARCVRKASSRTHPIPKCQSRSRRSAISKSNILPCRAIGKIYRLRSAAAILKLRLDHRHRITHLGRAQIEVYTAKADRTMPRFKVSGDQRPVEDLRIATP